MTSRIDLVSLGSATPWPGGGGLDLVGTGITVPSPDMQGLVAQVAARTTAVFAANRLPTAAVGSVTDGIELQELGVSSPFAGATFRLAVSVERELLVAASSATNASRVELWHLEPHGIGMTDLDAALLARVLPMPSEATARYRVAVNADGTGYELVEDGGGGRGTSAIYASVEQYRSRTGVGRTINSDLLNEELDAASRLIDQELGVVPGYFAPIAQATYIFPCDGGQVLFLRDEDGLAYGLRSVTAGGIRPDYDLTGAYDQYSWDLDDDFIWPRARNAIQLGRPYHALELRRIQRAPLTIWPWQDGSVQIEGAWGWESTPSPIRELTVKVARDQRDTLRGGAAGRAETIDDVSIIRPDTWRLWAEVKTRYSRRLPLVI